MKTRTTNKISTLVLTILALFLFGVVNGATAPGDLDTTFGTGGRVSTSFEKNAVAYAVAIQPDGKIVSGGVSNHNFVLSRHNPDGSLDTTFDGDGRVTTLIHRYIEAIAIQYDGKIVAAGSGSDGGSTVLVLARFNSDGSPDTTFDGDGKVTLGFEGYNIAYATGVAIQADGKIVAAGTTAATSGHCFALARFNIDGSLDGSFSDDGKVTTDFSGYIANASAVALQPDGKIIVAGETRLNPQATYDFALARYNADGSLDTTFDIDGKVTTTFGAASKANDLAVQSDGKIIVAGDSFAGGFSRNFALVRYNNNGSLDLTFDFDGKVTTDFDMGNEEANSVAILADGKIVASGGDFNNVAIARYNPNGSLDTGFSGDGKVNTSLGGGGHATALAIQTDSKIVVAGHVSNGGATDFLLLRYQSSSKAAADFDGDGRSDISVFRPSDRIWYLNQSTNGFSATQFGMSTDKITPADFDGDGRTDISIYRDGTWYWLNSSNNLFNAVEFGVSNDVPVPADYTGDGRAEIAVYRAGFWYTLNLSNNQFQAVQFGNSTDKPVVGDFDGDGRTDYTVFRPSNGTWLIQRSTSGYVETPFGSATDKAVPADYDGDGKADVAIFRPSEGIWYISNSATNNLQVINWGSATDTLVPADYDGDGKTDVAVFRNGVWYVKQTTGAINSVNFGFGTDVPVNKLE